MKVLRFDVGKLGKVQRTPQGGIKVPAALTRVGILVYENPDGSPRREYRPKEEVFKEDSLATLSDAPVTNLHHGMVDASNWRRVAVGAVSGSAREDAGKVVADLVIQDKTTIALIESNERREVSCGYECDLEWTPGQTPGGERYDAIQRNIRYNHVALVPRGRAGREIALRLDSEGNQTLTQNDRKSSQMDFEIINGDKHEVGTDLHRKAVAARQDAEGKAAAELSLLRKDNVDLKEKLSRQDAEVAERVKTRTELCTAAGLAKVTVREDMTDDELRSAVIGKVLPDMNLEGRDSKFVAGVFSVALTKIANGESSSSEQVREDAFRARTGSGGNTDDGPGPAVTAREAMIKRNQDANKNWNSRK